MVSVIIPAYNEENTILEVVNTTRKHSWISETIVVDDGSKDGTAKKVRETASKLIRLPYNQGKATAMDHGVANADNEIICFLDGDIKNLTQANLTELLEPLVKGDYEMFVGICGRQQSKLNSLLIFLPTLGGQRVITKELWKRIPSTYKQDFQIEVALNYFARVAGKKMGTTILNNLDHVVKEKKYGLIQGFFKRVYMIIDILKVGLILYGYETLKRKISQFFY